MPKSLDWPAIETFLVETATKQLAGVKSAEPFYGAIFDVEPYDGASVSLLLNTESHLTKEWGKTIEANDLHCRFMPSCFAPRFPLTKGAKAFPASAIEELTEVDMDEDSTDEDGLWSTTRALLDACCRVALKLESGAFAKLPRTPTFTIAVTPDPSEPGDFSVKRYATFKKRLAKGSGKATKKTPVKKPPSKARYSLKK